MQLLRQRAHESLGAAIAIQMHYPGRACLDAEAIEVVPEGVRDKRRPFGLRDVGTRGDAVLFS